MKVSEFKARAMIEIAAHLIHAIAAGAQINGDEIPRLATTHAANLADWALRYDVIERD